jgi:hypothetical protein
VQKIHSSGVLLYVVALNFYGYKAFFGKFMVVRVRLWSNTNLVRGEAPIGQIPVWADGVQCFVSKWRSFWGEEKRSKILM